MIDIRVVDGLYVITACKCVLILKKSDFIRALQAGKRWKQRQALAARLAVTAMADGEEDACRRH